MKKRYTTGIAIIIWTLLVTGCGISGQSGQEASRGENGQEENRIGELSAEPVEISFVYADGDEMGKAAMLEMVNRFNEQHEDIVVRVKPGNGNPYDEILKTLESVGEFPDILETYNVAAYVRAGMLAELPEDIIALFKNPVSIDGKVYTAPQSNNNTLGIVYNKRYFAENGLEEPRIYDEFKELCRRIGEMGDMYPLVVGAQDLWHIGFWFHKIYSDQVTSLDPDFIMHCYEGSRDFSDVSFRRALEEMREMIQYAQPEWASTPDAQVASYLIQGRAAMLYSGGHMLLTIPNLDSDFEIGWFAIPSPDGKLRMTGGAAANGFAISAEAARNPDRKAAAEEFIRFFFAKENYQYYCDARDIVPTTVDAPERQYSDLMKKMMEALESADEVGPMWNNEIGNRELPFDFKQEREKEMETFLQYVATVENNIYAAHFVGEDAGGESVEFHYSAQSTYFREEEGFLELIGYADLDRMSNRLILIPAHSAAYYGNASNQVMTIGRNYFDLRGEIGSRKYVGTLYVDINVQRIGALIVPSGLGKGEDVYVVNREGDCFFSTEKEDIGKNIAERLTELADAQAQTVISSSVGDSGLQVLVVMDRKWAFRGIARCRTFRFPAPTCCRSCHVWAWPAFWKKPPSNEIDNPDRLEICVNAAGDGEFALMEDDGQGTEYEEGHWCRTVLRMQTKNGILFTVLPAEGNLSVVPEERSYRIRFYGLDEGVNPAVSVNGADIRDFAAHYEKEKGILEIGLPAVPVRKQIAVRLDHARMHDNQKKARIYNYLNQAEIAFEDKENVYNRICKMESCTKSADIIRELQELPIREAVLEPVVEILTACEEMP